MCVDTALWEVSSCQPAEGASLRFLCVGVSEEESRTVNALRRTRRPPTPAEWVRDAHTTWPFAPLAPSKYALLLLTSEASVHEVTLVKSGKRDRSGSQRRVFRVYCRSLLVLLYSREAVCGRRRSLKAPQKRLPGGEEREHRRHVSPPSLSSSSFFSQKNNTKCSCCLFLPSQLPQTLLPSGPRWRPWSASAR